MVVLLGDIHGAVEWALPIAAKAKGHASGPVPVIQVGDLGWHPARPLLTPPWPVYWIDGNHDHLPSLLRHREPVEVAPNWIYCPRGSSLTLDGRRIGFFGGGYSIDRATRTEGRSWWPEEEPTLEEAGNLIGEDIDLLVTHTPPRSVIEAMGIDRPADEVASEVVETVWRQLGRPSLVCGHMHERFRRGNVLVLGDLDADVL